MTSDQYTVLDSTPVFTGRVIRVRTDEVRMSDGSVATREIVEHPGAVAVLALDDSGSVVVVNQYRHPVRRCLDELPAGLLDVDGESALAAAKRELFEEAALEADSWQLLVDLNTSPGMTDEAVRVYLARGLRQATEHFAAEHEELTLTVSRVPLADAVRRVLGGELTNAIAVAGILAASHAEREGWSGLRSVDTPWPDRRGR